MALAEPDTIVLAQRGIRPYSASSGETVTQAQHNAPSQGGAFFGVAPESASGALGNATRIVSRSGAQLELWADHDDQGAQLGGQLGAVLGGQLGDHDDQGAQLGGQLADTTPLRDAAMRSRNRYILQDCAKELLPDWRVARCMRQQTNGMVSIIYNPEYETASYGGLMVCGSVWTCPVCAAKIGARRTEEIEIGVNKWADMGNSLFMLTLTMRHHMGRRLDELLDIVNAAYRKLHQGRKWVDTEKRYHIHGAISAREVTYGGNGWHPHLHVLLFIEGKLSFTEREVLADWFSVQWVEALRAMGEDATLQHGSNFVEANKDASEYVSKLTATWNSASEIAGINSKKGKQGGQTPAQLLNQYNNGSSIAGKRFVEYAKATKGHNWIVWTPGLKAELLGEDAEKTDETIAQEEKQGGVTMVVLSTKQWFSVREQKARGELLYIASSGITDDLRAWFIAHGIDLQPWQWGEGANKNRIEYDTS